MRLSLDRATFFIVLFYLLAPVYLTWPLIMNLDGILEVKVDESMPPRLVYRLQHVDTLAHLERVQEAKELLQQRRLPIVADEANTAQTFIFFSIIAMSFLKVSDMASYNLYFLLSIALAGLFMYLYMLELSKDKLAAYFSGFIYMSSVYSLSVFIVGAPQYMQIQWIPLVFLFLEKAMHQNQIKYAVFLGVALALQILSTAQYTVYMSLIVPIYILLRIGFNDKQLLFRKFFWTNLLVSVIVAAGLSSFYLIKRMNTPAIIRTLEENLVREEMLSSLNQIIEIYANLYLLIIGLSVLLLGIFIIARYSAEKKYRKYNIFVAILMVIILFMIGPISVTAPYFWLYKFWPFVSLLRMELRFFPFALLCSSVLSSVFVVHLNNMPAFKRYRFAIVISLIISMLISRLFLDMSLMRFIIVYL